MMEIRLAPIEYGIQWFGVSLRISSCGLKNCFVSTTNGELIEEPSRIAVCASPVSHFSVRLDPPT